MTKQPALIPDIEPLEVADLSHAEERRLFEFALRDLPWGEDYAVLLAKEGLRWREAAYIAWAMQPKELRVPKTQGELAKVLGCSGEKVSRMANNPIFEALKLKSARLEYLKALPDILRASIEVASKPTYKSTPERNNVLNKILGLGTEELLLNLGQAANADLSRLSDEELTAMLNDHDDE